VVEKLLEICYGGSGREDGIYFKVLALKFLLYFSGSMCRGSTFGGSASVRLCKYCFVGAMEGLWTRRGYLGTNRKP
jgi:hypothetical protein